MSSVCFSVAGAGEINRGTKSSAGFLGAGGAVVTAGAGAAPSTGAIRRGVQSALAFGRCAFDSADDDDVTAAGGGVGSVKAGFGGA